MDRLQGDRTANPIIQRPLHSRAGTPLVGRREELVRLATALDLAADGHGCAVFLTGQPGIGKTRLAQECLALARARGFTALEGRGLSLGSGRAYSPIVGALGPLLRSLDSADLEALVGGLPDLGRLFDSVQLPPPSFPLEGLGDPALEKTRLFGAVDRLLERLAEQVPVVLFIDDMHWADDSTLELLQYLASGLSRRRMLMLATYAADAFEDSYSLRTLVAWLLRS
ncbi:MAG: ATP-binding protein, partial [Dehalococcoidia bacterium]|nr:ATP-binding protein [Dehalococcoidia bacterium]